MKRVTMLVSSDSGRFVKVAHRPRDEMPDRLAVKVDGVPATNVSYTPLPARRGTLFAVGKTRLGDALLAAVNERPVVADVDRGRVVVALSRVSWKGRQRMTRSSTLPVVAIGKDSHGLPTRLSIPDKLTRPIPVVLNGQRLGEVARDGSVSWTGPSAGGSYAEYLALGDALREAARSRKRLRAAVIDGKVTAIVVPSRRRS